MGMFSKILNKLGIKKDAEKAAPAPEVKKEAKSAPVKRYPPAKKPSGPKGSTVEKRSFAKRPSAAGEMPMVDVLSKHETMAKGSGLDWKVSIVDLLKVLGIDSSREARKELAEELGCPPEIMGGDSAKMNVWLHKKVLAEIAENGGNIPKELLD